MRHSKTLARLRAGLPVRLCSLGHYIPSFVRHAAHFGFDCIWLDLEHRLVPDVQVEALLAHFQLSDIDCMLRPPTLEKTRLYRYLEDGATGLMIPHVSTVEKARQLVDAVKFPPIGDRGLDGAGLDADYYVHPADAYVDHANRETFLVVQIETLEALENVEAIAAVPGVDGLFVGPGDLGLRIRRAAQTRWTLERAFEHVAEAAARYGKAWGCPAATADDVARLRDQGAQLVAFGSEYLAQMRMLEQTAQTLSQLYPDAD